MRSMAKSTPRSMSSEVRDRNLRWLAFLERATGKSLSEIGTNAGKAHTTLTRFRSKASLSSFNAATVEAVKKLTGLPGPDEFELMTKPAAVAVAGFREEAALFDHGADNQTARIITAIIGDRPGVHAWSMKSDALTSAGVLPGDVVVIDQHKSPAPGDVVCAQIYDRPGGLKADTVLRLYRPGWLVTASANPILLEPVQIVDGKVVIMGTAIGVYRASA